MNTRAERHVLNRAIEQLRSSTGIEAHLDRSDDEQFLIRLHFPDRTLTYRPVVRARIDRVASLSGLLPVAKPQLLVTGRLSHDLASKARDLGIQFIDTAGNAFLSNAHGVYVFVAGRKDDANERFTKSLHASTPAALRVTFALLARSNLVSGSIRDIATASGVSLGATAHALNALTGRGYLGIDGSGKRKIVDRRQLVIEWSAGYINQIRPKLHSSRFAIPSEALRAILEWKPQPGVAAWGGEVAAAHLTQNLKPATLTLYKDKDVLSPTSWLVKHFRLRADPAGELEIVDSFWDWKALGIEEIVPPELIYADLIATLNSRNMEVANNLLDKVIAHA